MARLELENLRAEMLGKNIDAVIIVTDDFHGSEYVGNFFKCREYISGFTGSAGTLLVTKEDAFLWTDGRYFIQAESELSGSEIKLMKMGEKNVPALKDFLKENAVNGWQIAFDGRCVNENYFEELKDALSGIDVRWMINTDMVGMIWKDRPEISHEKAWILDEKYAGASRKEKLSALREKMAEQDAQIMVLSALDEIAYLFNIRGADVEYNPVVLSYAIITDSYAILYVNDEAFDENVRAELVKDGAIISNYDQIYEDLKHLPAGAKVMCDKSSINCLLYGAIPAGAEKIDSKSPVKAMKSVKNPVEMANEIQAHIKDGVAVTKFIYYLKKHFDTETLTELDVCDKLEEFRKLGEGYLGQSFEPIAASGEHGAIVHYSATKESNIELVRDNLLLLDTGGHYLLGTTDITRTIAIGNVSHEMKELYTAVLCGNLNLSDVYFKEGTAASGLDYVAREPLMRRGLNYRHGTGHGVGYLLNVHEGPNSFNKDGCPQEEGMITSNEPGVYLEGKFGIRLENLLMCVKDRETEYGTFLKMQVLTQVPFDRNAILPEQMSEKQLTLLNEYHKNVYETISPFLDEDEKKWLYEETKEIHRD